MRVAPILGAAAWMLLLPAALHSQAAASDNAYIRRAQLGAPRSISAEAAIARIEKDGKVTSIRDGKNGFTCGTIPDGGNSPVCADQAGWDFLVSAFTHQDKPKSDKPGIAYMMQGGRHWESKSGDIVMEPGNGAHMAKEPPHWMLLAPFDDVVFERTWKDGGLTFVAASQAAVDLLTSPGRAPSEAEAILERLVGNTT